MFPGSAFHWVFVCGGLPMLPAAISIRLSRASSVDRRSLLVALTSVDMAPLASSFWLLRPDALPAHGLCKYAEACPKLRATGDATKDQDNSLINADVQYVVDMLARNPEHITATKGYMSARLQRPKEDERNTFKEASTLGKIAGSEKLLVGWLLQHTKLTAAECDKIKSYDTDDLKQLLFYGTALQPSLVLSPECASKTIASLALKARFDHVGKRLEALGGGVGIRNDGCIKWSEVAPYKVTVAGNKVQALEHRPTSVVVELPANVSVAADFSMESPLSETKARFVYGLNKYTVVDFFRGGEGPYAPNTKILGGKSSVFNALVRHVADEQLARERAAAAGARSSRSLVRRASEPAPKRSHRRRGRL